VLNNVESLTRKENKYMCQEIPPSRLPKSHEVISLGVMIVGAGVALKLFKIFLRRTLHKRR